MLKPSNRRKCCRLDAWSGTYLYHTGKMCLYSDQTVNILCPVPQTTKHTQMIITYYITKKYTKFVW